MRAAVYAALLVFSLVVVVVSPRYQA